MSRFSVKRPMTVLVAVVLIIITGVVSFTKMQTDLLPSIDLPYVLVMTTYPGASPDEVEMTITKPVEQSMATIANVNSVSSVSNEHYSMVIMEFDDSANMDTATIDIRESLDLLESAWTNDRIGSPIIYKINPDMLPIMIAAVDVEGMNNVEISKYLESDILPRLESVEGVASVSASGLIDEEISVILRQEKIDKINEKLQKSIDDKMSEAQQQLDNAYDEIKTGKEELESGKAELETKKQEAQTQIQDAENQLEQARLDLVKKEKEVADGLAELEKQKKELQANLDKVNAGLTEIEKGEKELKEQKAALKENKKQVNAGLEQIKASEEQLAASKAQLEAAIAATNADTSMDETVKAAKLQELNTQLATVEAGETEAATKKAELQAASEQIKAGEQELGKAEETLKAKRQEAEAGKKQLTEGLKTVNAYIDEAKAGQKAIASGKTEISNKKDELATKKSEAEEQFSQAEDEIVNAEQQLISGEDELNKQIETFDEAKANAYKEADISKTLTIDMLTGILTAQNFSMPAGYVTEDDVQYLVRVGDKLSSAADIEELVLFDPGVEGLDPVKLSDVADVMLINNSDEVYAKVNGNDAIVLSFEKQNSYSTAEVTDDIVERFDELRESSEKLHVTYLMNQGLYIDMVVDSVLNNLIVGAILAVIILIFFLKDLRPTFIVAISIPISVIFAVALMYFSGITLNVISLSGLAVGVGMLVDNSIVVIENIFRLRQKGVSAVKAAVSGATQVCGAIVASTLTTVCVFAPIVFVEGITKQLFVDMALTIGYSLVASLIIALTVVPAMSAGMLKRTKEKKHRLMDWLTKGYEKIMVFSLKFKPVVLLLVLALLVGSVYLSLSRGTVFMPEMDSPQITVNVSFSDDLRSEATGEKLTDKEQLAFVDEAMARIGTIEDIDSVGAMQGGGLLGGMGGNLLGGQSGGTSISMYVLLKEDKTQTSQAIAEEINKLCADMPCEVNASGSNMDMSALGGSGLTYNIKGQDSTELIRIAREISALLSGVEGITEVSDGTANAAKEIKITVDKDKAILKGLTVAQVYMEISSKLAEAKTATTLSGSNSEYPVIAYDIVKDTFNKDFINNYTFNVKGMDGTESEVKLSDIANITEQEGLTSIRRSANQRYVSVTAAIAEGYNIGLVGNEADKLVNEYEMPDGYQLVSQGENKMIMESITELIKMLLLAIAFVYLIMVAQFQSLLSPFIIMFTIPLAFTGGFLGLYLTGNEISVISLIGFVMISGIIVNNGIVLVDYINKLRREGMAKREALIEAGKTRMRPVLMTALTTVLGLSTMAIGMGMGADMVQPIAIVAIGGLLYGTLTTIFIVPVIYDLLNRKEMKVVAESELEAITEDQE